MKHITLLLMLMTLCSFVGIGQEAKLYAVRSGYLRTELSGSTVGTRELWWDNYGKTSTEIVRSTTTTKIFGIKSKSETHTTTVFKDGNYWTVDHIEGNALKGRAVGYDEGMEMASSMTEEEKEALGEEILAGFGGEKLGKETINGYECDVFKVLGVKSWVHKGLTLKVEGKVLGVTANENVAKIELNKAVASSRFVPPSGFEYESMDELMGDSQGESMQDIFNEALSDEDDEQIVPVDYPFEKFKKVIAEFHPKGYKGLGCNSMYGTHSASFIGLRGSLMVVCQNKDNIEFDHSSEQGFETFTYHGHKCHYGQLEEDEGVALIVEYPSNDMVIVITALSKKDKDAMLSFSDELDF